MPRSSRGLSRVHADSAHLHRLGEGHGKLGPRRAWPFPRLCLDLAKPAARSSASTAGALHLGGPQSLRPVRLPPVLFALPQQPSRCPSHGLLHAHPHLICSKEPAIAHVSQQT